MAQLRKFTDKQIRFLASRDRDVMVRAFTKHLRVAYVRTTDAAAHAVRQHRIHNHWAAAELADLMTASALMASFLDGRENVFARCDATPTSTDGLAGISAHAFRSGEIRAMIRGGIAVHHPLPEELRAGDLGAQMCTISSMKTDTGEPSLEAAGRLRNDPFMTVERGLYGMTKPRTSIVEASWASSASSQQDSTSSESSDLSARDLVRVPGFSGSASATGLVNLIARSDEICGLVHLEHLALPPPSGLGAVASSLFESVANGSAPVHWQDVDAGITARVAFSGGILAELLPGGDPMALEDLQIALDESSGGGIETLVSRLAARAESRPVALGVSGGSVLDAARLARDAEAASAGVDSAAALGRFDPLRRGIVGLQCIQGEVVSGQDSPADEAEAQTARDRDGTLQRNSFPCRRDTTTALGVLAAGDFAAGANIPPQALLMALCNYHHRTECAGAATTVDREAYEHAHAIDEPDANWFDSERFSILPVHLFCGCSQEGFVGKLESLNPVYLLELQAELEQGKGAWPGGSSHLLRCSWCSSAYKADKETLKAVAENHS